jgi:alpha-L-glutamate ligase-like protein
LADDKVRTKRVLEIVGIPTPTTLAVLETLTEVTAARDLLEETGEFVLKPARGRQGRGILVVVGREAGEFLTLGGERYSWDALRGAMGNILFAVHSVGSADTVLVERRVRPLAAIREFAGSGLPDVRIILLHGVPAMAMMRVATRASGGRANLHCGALGVALRLDDGLAFRCVADGAPVEHHPDTGLPMTGFRIPYWDGLLETARRTARAIPLPYLGVDLTLDETAGPMVMEVNVRPGLEIQNVNGRGLRRTLERIESRKGAMS